MGTINYFTSDYITLGIPTLSSYDLEKDAELMNELNDNVKEYGGTIEDEIQEYINQSYEDDEANIQAILDKYSFYYYHIVIKPGYYEGFTLDIENNFKIAYDSHLDKKEAQKEITQLKKMLIEMAGCGLVEVHPGWVTTYLDYKDTIKGIIEAVKEMRDECSFTPTWNKYLAAER